jgi:uncharacterized protein (TIGR03066 family)
MRAMLGWVAVLGLAVAVNAAPRDDKKGDKKTDTATKLIGKWAPISNKKIAKELTEEFTKDGKYFFGTGDVKSGSKTEGTYKLDGDDITITTVREGEKNTRTVTIKKLTDTDMELSFGGKIVPFKRVK